jgi:6-phosphogluconolactonase (cycloisomerase 2 family)
LGALVIGLFGVGESRIIAAATVPSALILPYYTVFEEKRDSNSVSVYRIDASTGALRRAAGSPVPSGQGPHLEALSPDGRFAYVVNDGSHSISAYAFDAGTGALRPVKGSPFPLDYSPSAYSEFTILPAGTFAYVVSDAGISAFSIDATTGALAPVPGSPFATTHSDGVGTVSMAIDPSQRFAYVVNQYRGTLATYSIGKTGALELSGSMADAAINNNAPGSTGYLKIDPKGRFLYVTGINKVEVYALDPASGTLATPPAHLSLGIGVNAGFRLAIDPAGKFAYAIDGERIYSYTIGATNGALKAVPGRKFALSTAADASDITIDPTGRFVYVFAAGSKDFAPSVSAYSINPATGELTPLARSPFTIAADLSDPIHRWFNAGRCPVFNDVRAEDTAPFTKLESDGVVFERPQKYGRGYYYDPKSHAALYYPSKDSEGTFTLRLIGPPPRAIQPLDLALHTKSGISLGSSADSVVAALGKPKIVRGCGRQRYIYLRSREGEPESLQFTIDNGRVIEIFEDFPG